jgi:hypothetical protein
MKVNPFPTNKSHLGSSLLIINSQQIRNENQIQVHAPSTNILSQAKGANDPSLFNRAVKNQAKGLTRDRQATRPMFIYSND